MSTTSYDCGSCGDRFHVDDIDFCPECNIPLCASCYEKHVTGNGLTVGANITFQDAFFSEASERVVVMCSRVTLDPYQFHDYYVVLGMEHADKAEVETLLADRYATPLGGIAANPSQECKDDCPYHCEGVVKTGRLQCTATEGFAAKPLALTQLATTWIGEQVWSREVK